MEVSLTHLHLCTFCLPSGPPTCSLDIKNSRVFLSASLDAQCIVVWFLWEPVGSWKEQSSGRTPWDPSSAGHVGGSVLLLPRLLRSSFSLPLGVRVRVILKTRVLKYRKAVVTAGKADCALLERFHPCLCWALCFCLSAEPCNQLTSLFVVISEAKTLVRFRLQDLHPVLVIHCWNCSRKLIFTGDLCFCTSGFK